MMRLHSRSGCSEVELIYSVTLWTFSVKRDKMSWQGKLLITEIYARKNVVIKE